MGLGATLVAAVAVFTASELRHADITFEVTSNIGEADCDLKWSSPDLSGWRNEQTWSFHIRHGETLSRLQFGMPPSVDWTCRTKEGAISGHESGCGYRVDSVRLKKPSRSPSDFALC